MSVLHVQGQPPPYSESHNNVISSAHVVLSNTAVPSMDISFQQSLPTLTKFEPVAPAELEVTNVQLKLQHELPQSPGAAAQFESFKQNIYNHPLFPLLAMVFEKCESSTAAPDDTSHSFEDEMEAFMKHQQSLKMSGLGDDDELNELMIKGVQVLRIHLLEMEKVNDLCQDFCARYTTCLKGKLTSETLLHVDGCDDDSFNTEPQDLSLSHSPQNGLNLSTGHNLQPQQHSPSSAIVTASGATAVVATPTVVGGNVVLQAQPSQQTQIVSGNTVYQMVQTPQGIVAQPIQIQGPIAAPVQQAQVQPVIHGSTPLSQIGMPLNNAMQQQQQQPPQQQHQQQHKSQQQPQSQNDIKLSILQHKAAEDDDDEKFGKQKRGILPKHATQVMKSWLFQHIVHPYPTEDEKRQIASQTNLTLLQVNNWFINARRRILQPMLEAANPDKGNNKQKKPLKPASGLKQQSRHWPMQNGGGSNGSEGGVKQEGLSNGEHSSDMGGTESESDSAPNPMSAGGSTTMAHKPQTSVLQQNTTTSSNVSSSILTQQQQAAAALRLSNNPAAVQQLMGSGGMIGAGGGVAGFTADRLQQLQQQMQLASSLAPTAHTAPSMEAAALMAQSEAAAALMGGLPGSGVVYKLSPEGQLIPTAAHTQPPAQTNPAPLTMESLQALQQAGLVLGSTPMPFSLPPGLGGAGLGFGLGFNPGLAGLSAQMPSPALGAPSAFPLGALNFAASPYAAQLQFAHYLNPSAPMDLSSMPISSMQALGPGLQLGQFTAAGQASTQLSSTAGQVYMGLSTLHQEAGSEVAGSTPENRPGAQDDGLEAGELKIDLREKYGQGEG